MADSVKTRKFYVVGSRSVGKSSLVVRFVDNHFVESYYPTIENTFTKRYKSKATGEEYDMQIVDTAGLDEYSNPPPAYFIETHGFFLMFSVGSKQSFETVRIIRDKILNGMGLDEFPMILVGTKSDYRPEQRQVSKQEGKELAEEFNIAYVETSARYNDRIDEAFERMLDLVKIKEDPPKAPPKVCRMM